MSSPLPHANLLREIPSAKRRSSLAWAEATHRGVFRRGDHSPYVRHCVDVSSHMIAAGGTRNQVVACDLHDTVEDSDHLPVLSIGACDEQGMLLPRRVTVEDIFVEFGPDVAAYVGSVSKSDDLKGVVLEDQAALVMDQLLSLHDVPGIEDPDGGLKVKGCDVLVNGKDIIWDFEREGVLGIDRVFKRERAERKIRHYAELMQCLSFALRDCHWGHLADELIYRRVELLETLDRYLRGVEVESSARN